MPSASTDWYRTALTALLTLVLQRLWQRINKRQKSLADRVKWDAHEDLGNVQACLLTSVNLDKCGRVEKRTVLSKRLEEIFTNDHVRAMILEAANKCTDDNPFVCSHLKMEDRWHVLVAAQNHISSIFGPYHLFANQVSSYESCWYVFTLVGTRTHGSGRFFITPDHRLSSKHDVGAMRIRLVLVLEQELRKICCGDIVEPRELFSERHQARWKLMKRFATVFEKQLTRVTQPAGMLDVRSQSWGANLCGTAKRNKKLLDKSHSSKDKDDDETDPDCNNFLRLHVPIPLVKETQHMGPQDVVLYE